MWSQPYWTGSNTGKPAGHVGLPTMSPTIAGWNQFNPYQNGYVGVSNVGGYVNPSHIQSPGFPLSTHAYGNNSSKRKGLSNSDHMNARASKFGKKNKSQHISTSFSATLVQKDACGDTIGAQMDHSNTDMSKSDVRHGDGSDGREIASVQPGDVSNEFTGDAHGTSVSKFAGRKMNIPRGSKLAGRGSGKLKTRDLGKKKLGRSGNKTKSLRHSPVDMKGRESFEFERSPMDVWGNVSGHPSAFGSPLPTPIISSNSWPNLPIFNPIGLPSSHSLTSFGGASPVIFPTVYELPTIDLSTSEHALAPAPAVAASAAAESREPKTEAPVATQEVNQNNRSAAALLKQRVLKQVKEAVPSCKDSETPGTDLSVPLLAIEDSNAAPVENEVVGPVEAPVDKKYKIFSVGAVRQLTPEEIKAEKDSRIRSNSQSRECGDFYSLEELESDAFELAELVKPAAPLLGFHNSAFVAPVANGACNSSVSLCAPTFRPPPPPLPAKPLPSPRVDVLSTERMALVNDAANAIMAAVKNVHSTKQFAALLKEQTDLVEPPVSASNTPVSISPASTSVSILDSQMEALSEKVVEDDEGVKEYFCELCNVKAQSAMVWKAHINGKRHLKKCKQAGTLPPSAAEDTASATATSEEPKSKLLEKEESDEANKVTKVEIIPRVYQLEVLEAAIRCNTLAFLETGSGKTLIAVMLIKLKLAVIRKRYKARLAELINEKSPAVVNGAIVHTEIPAKSLIAFVAPTKLLLEQQRRYIAGNCECKIQSFTGGEMNLRNLTRAQWIRNITSIEIMMLTPEIFRSILQQQLIPVGAFDLVIFDECHHCVRKSPMALCCHTIQQEKPQHRPRIFGMTASPISGKKGSVSKKLLELETLLDCKLIKPKSEIAVHELNTLVPKPTLSVLSYPGEIHANSLLSFRDVYHHCPQENAIEEEEETTARKIEDDLEAALSCENLFSCFSPHAGLDTTGILLPLHSVHVMLHGYQRIRYAMYLWNIRILIRDLGVTASELPQLEGLHFQYVSPNPETGKKKRKGGCDERVVETEGDGDGCKGRRYRFKESTKLNVVTPASDSVMQNPNKRKLAEVEDDMGTNANDVSTSPTECLTSESVSSVDDTSKVSMQIPIEFEDDFSLQRRQHRMKQKKSVNELMQAYGQIIIMYKDCGLLCALEALRVASKPNNGPNGEDASNSMDVSVSRNMTIDLSRIEGMKNEILSGPFEEHKLAQVNTCACFSLLGIFSCFAANIGSDKCAAAINIINATLLKSRENKDDNTCLTPEEVKVDDNTSKSVEGYLTQTHASAFKLIICLLMGIANGSSSAIGEIVSGSDGVFESMMQAKCDSQLWFTEASEDQCTTRLNLHHICTAIHHACACLLQTITPRELVSMVLSPTVNDRVGYVDIKEMIHFEQEASKTRNQCDDGDAYDSLLQDEEVDADNGSASKEKRDETNDDINAHMKLVTMKVCTLMRYLLSIHPAGSVNDNVSNSVEVSDKFYSQFLFENQQQYKTAGMSADESLGDWSCIVFCRMKFSACTLCWLLTVLLDSVKQLMSQGPDTFAEMFPSFPQSSCWELLKPKFITGGVKQFDQVSTLLAFKCGQFNTLFATDVCEEGIHVRVCKLVVNFDLPTTVKSYIQRRGRARAENSLMVAMLADDESGIVGFRDLATFAATECVMSDRSMAPISLINQQALMDSFNLLTGSASIFDRLDRNPNDDAEIDLELDSITRSLEDNGSNSSSALVSKDGGESQLATYVDPLASHVMQSMNQSAPDDSVVDFSYTTAAGICIGNIDIVNYMHDYCSSLPKDKYYTPKEVYWISFVEPDEKLISYECIASYFPLSNENFIKQSQRNVFSKPCSERIVSTENTNIDGQPGNTNDEDNESQRASFIPSQKHIKKLHRELKRVVFYRCSILLPPSVPINVRCHVGPLSTGKMQAKFEAIALCMIRLHRAGELDDYFRAKYPSNKASKQASVTNIVNPSAAGNRAGDGVNEAELVIENFKSSPQFQLIPLKHLCSTPNSPRMWFYRVQAETVYNKDDPRLYINYNLRTESYKRMVSDLNSVAMGWILRSLNSLVLMTTRPYAEEIFKEQFPLFFRGNVQMRVKITTFCDRLVNMDIIQAIAAFNQSALARQKTGVGEFIETSMRAASEAEQDMAELKELLQPRQPVPEATHLNWCSLVPVDPDFPCHITDDTPDADAHWLYYLQRSAVDAKVLYNNLCEHRRRALTGEQSFDENNGMAFLPIVERHDYANMVFGSIFNPTQCYVGVPNSSCVPILNLDDTFMVKYKPNKDPAVIAAMQAAQQAEQEAAGVEPHSEGEQPQPKKARTESDSGADGTAPATETLSSASTPAAQPVTYVSRSYLDHFLMKQLVPDSDLLRLASTPGHGLISALSISTNRAYIALLDRSTDDITPEIELSLRQAEEKLLKQQTQGRQSGDAMAVEAQDDESDSSQYQITSKNLLSHLVPEYCRVIGHARWYYFAMAAPAVVWRFHSLIHTSELRAFMLEKEQQSRTSSDDCTEGVPLTESMTMEVVDEKIEHDGADNSNGNNNASLSSIELNEETAAVTSPRLPVVQPPLVAMIEAVSPRMIHDISNYECMEWFGDIILKYIATCEVFFANPDDHEGSLTAKRCAYINNSNLINKSRASHVYRFMRTFAMSDGNRTLFHLFQGKAYKNKTAFCRPWKPIKPIATDPTNAQSPSNSESAADRGAASDDAMLTEIAAQNEVVGELAMTHQADYGDMVDHDDENEDDDWVDDDGIFVKLCPFKLKAKLLADLIESLIGCYFIHGGVGGAVFVMERLGVLNNTQCPWLIMTPDQQDLVKQRAKRQQLQLLQQSQEVEASDSAAADQETSEGAGGTGSENCCCLGESLTSTTDTSTSSSFVEPEAAPVVGSMDTVIAQNKAKYELLRIPDNFPPILARIVIGPMLFNTQESSSGSGSDDLFHNNYSLREHKQRNTNRSNRNATLKSTVNGTEVNAGELDVMRALLEDSAQYIHDKLGYQFRDLANLQEALTHCSVQHQKSNQRLEYLGDAVLDMAVAMMLYKKHGHTTQGMLSSAKSDIVNNKNLAGVSLKLELYKHMTLSSNSLRNEFYDIQLWRDAEKEKEAQQAAKAQAAAVKFAVSKRVKQQQPQHQNHQQAKRSERMAMSELYDKAVNLELSETIAKQQQLQQQQHSMHEDHQESENPMVVVDPLSVVEAESSEQGREQNVQLPLASHEDGIDSSSANEAAAVSDAVINSDKDDVTLTSSTSAVAASNSNNNDKDKDKENTEEAMNVISVSALGALADLFEALVGAIFIDSSGNLEAIKAMVRKVGLVPFDD